MNIRGFWALVVVMWGMLALAVLADDWTGLKEEWYRDTASNLLIKNCVTSEDPCDECHRGGEDESHTANDCVHVTVGMGVALGSSQAQAGFLRFKEDRPSPLMYSPYAL